MKRASRAGRAAALVLVVAVAAIVPLVLASAPEARAVTPTLILGGNRVGEFQGVRAGEFIAWQQNSRQSPGQYDLFARPLGGGGAFKVNAAGTKGANGGIDGDVLLYQEFGKGKSDLKLFDLADRTRSSPPRGVNTKQWEYWPSMSGDHLLFGRLNPKGVRRIILFDVASRDATTLAKVKGSGTFLAPGQVNGDYAVWSKCATKRRCKVVLYRISDGTQTTIPNPGGRDHAPSVTPDGVVYFARSGGGCGSGTKLLRFLPGGPATVLWRLPSGDDVGTTRAFLDAGGETRVLVRPLRVWAGDRVRRVGDRGGGTDPAVGQPGGEWLGNGHEHPTRHRLRLGLHRDLRRRHWRHADGRHRRGTRCSPGGAERARARARSAR